MVRLALAGACDGSAHADDVLEALYRELVNPNQGEAVAGSGLLKLIGGNLAGLEQAQDFLSCLLYFGFKSTHPLLDGGRGPGFWGVVLEGGVGPSWG